MIAVTRWAVRIHKWLALIVGLQIVLWVLGGLVMSVLPIEAVRSEHTIPAPVSRPLALDTLLSPAAAAREAEVSRVRSAALGHWNDRPVYRFDTPDGVVMVDAQSGARLSPLDEAAARRTAQANYAGAAPISSVRYFETPTWEYRRSGPAWRAEFDDGEGTRLYISPDSGEVTARRNDRWRVFDFFWMLHVMDYKERENFNHPLLISMAGMALVTVMAGLVLLVIRVRRAILVQRSKARTRTI